MATFPFILENRLQYKEHYAKFLFTVNSNRTIVDRNDPYRFIFQTAIRTLNENFKDFILTLPGYAPDPNPVIFITPKIEIGGRLGRIHAHLIIEVFYDGKIRIDLPKIRNINIFHTEGWYVNIRYDNAGSHSMENTLKYLREEYTGENLYYA